MEKHHYCSMLIIFLLLPSLMTLPDFPVIESALGQEDQIQNYPESIMEDIESAKNDYVNYSASEWSLSSLPGLRKYFHYPQVLIDDLGNLHCVWTESERGLNASYDSAFQTYDTESTLVYATNMTGEWMEHRIANLSSIDTPFPVANYGHLALDKFGNPIVGFSAKEGESFEVFVANGSNNIWVYSQLTSNSTGDDILEDLLVDSLGDLHVLWTHDFMNEGLLERDLCYASSVDGWMNHIIHSSLMDGNITEYAELAVGFNGFPYIVRQDDHRYYPQDPYIVYQFKNETGWYEETPQESQNEVRPDIAVDSDGTVHVVSIGYSGGPMEQAYNYRIVYQNKTGNVWASEVINTKVGGIRSPSIRVDDDNQPVIAWPDVINQVSFRNESGWNTYPVISESEGIIQEQTELYLAITHSGIPIIVNLRSIAYPQHVDALEIVVTAARYPQSTSTVLAGLVPICESSISVENSITIHVAWAAIFRGRVTIFYTSNQDSQWKRYAVMTLGVNETAEKLHIIASSSDKMVISFLKQTSNNSTLCCLVGNRTKWLDQNLETGSCNITDYAIGIDSQKGIHLGWISQNESFSIGLTEYINSSWVTGVLSSSEAPKRQISLQSLDSSTTYIAWSELDNNQWDIFCSSKNHMGVNTLRVTSSPQNDTHPSVAASSTSGLSISWSRWLSMGESSGLSIWNPSQTQQAEIYYSNYHDNEFSEERITSNDHNDTAPVCLIDGSDLVHIYWRRRTLNGEYRIMNAIRQSNGWITQILVEKDYFYGTSIESISASLIDTSIGLAWQSPTDSDFIIIDVSGMDWNCSKYIPRIELTDKMPLLISASHQAQYERIVAAQDSYWLAVDPCPRVQGWAIRGQNDSETSIEFLASTDSYPNLFPRAGGSGNYVYQPWCLGRNGLMLIPIPFVTEWNMSISTYDSIVAELDETPTLLEYNGDTKLGYLSDKNLIDVYSIPYVHKGDRIDISLESDPGVNLDLFVDHMKFSRESTGSGYGPQQISLDAPASGNLAISVYRASGSGYYSISMASEYRFNSTSNEEVSYEDVLLITNVNSTVSQLTSSYFKSKRPIVHEVLLNCTDDEEIDRDTFNQYIRLPIENYLASRDLTESINYMVTTKGVPLKIADGDTYSWESASATVDSELSALFTPYLGNNGSAPNPLCNNQRSLFDPIYYVPFSSKDYGIYLVTRLTGYDINDIKELIDSATNASALDKLGQFIIDEKTVMGGWGGYAHYWWDAYQLLDAYGYNVTYDYSDAFIHDSENVSGYISWGSNDPNYQQTNFSYLPGAIGFMGVSTGARTFDNTTGGQNLIADLIHDGITGVIGWAYEPYTDSLPESDVFFYSWLTGYTLAESFYYSSRHIVSWKQVIVGDPKATLGINARLQLGVPRSYNISRISTPSGNNITIEGQVDSIYNMDCNIILRQPASEWTISYATKIIDSHFSLEIPSIQLDGEANNGIETYFAEIIFPSVVYRNYYGFEEGMPLNDKQYRPFTIKTEIFYDGANQNPCALIRYPGNGSFVSSHELKLKGWSLDPDWDEVTCSWSSSIDGNLGSLMSIDAWLSEGVHEIVFSSSDGNLTSECKILLTIDTTAPVVTATYSPPTPTELDSIAVTAEIVDSSGISQVILSFSDDSGQSWTNSCMIENGGNWTGLIPPHKALQEISFRVFAEDHAGNWGLSPQNTLIVASSDDEGPRIYVTHSPSNPTESDGVNITAEVTDVSGVHMVYISYSTDGASWIDQAMTHQRDSNNWTIQVPAQAAGTTVRYVVHANDTFGNCAESPQMEYLVSFSQSISVPIILGMSALGMTIVLIVLYTKYRKK